MANESNKVNNITHSRMEAGFDVLEAWSETANPTRKNAVYRALFAMQDGSLFRTHHVVEDFQRADELTVVVKEDLAMKIRVKSFDAFDVVFIGPRRDHHPAAD
jgi:uncharacterized protein DUF6235